MKRLIYNDKAFRILNNIDVSMTNNEVTFNDIIIDFTGYTLADMPLKYQEVKIKDCEEGEDILTQGEVMFFGYVDTIEVGRMVMSEEKRELTITLLSPLKLATVRTITAKGTYQLADLINLIFEPLINDGYTIEELNVYEGQITVNYIMQTIEYCMNELGRKRDIFWTIDEHKKIYVNSIDILFSKESVKNINNTKEEKGLLRIEPQIQATDYANVINIKNARLIYEVGSYEGVHNLFEQLYLPKTIKTGDIVELNYPFTTSLEYLKQIKSELELSDNIPSTISVFRIYINDVQYVIKYNLETEQLEYTGSITYSDGGANEGTIVLQRDSFFKNLITGFKWNGSNNATIGLLSSSTALRYTKIKFVNTQEIEKLKGIVSESGQIEKTVDANETWFTEKTLLDYAQSLLIQNTNDINTIILEYDYNYGFKIGDIVNINLPQFYCVGQYAITEIRIMQISKNIIKYEITMKKSNFFETYIDIFRTETTEKNDEKEESLYISEYVFEGVNEKHNIVEVEDES